MLNGVIYGFENSFQNKAKALVDCYVQKGYRAEDFNGKRLGWRVSWKSRLWGTFLPP